jgi:hypothetical protein
MIEPRWGNERGERIGLCTPLFFNALVELRRDIHAVMEQPQDEKGIGVERVGDDMAWALDPLA